MLLRIVHYCMTQLSDQRLKQVARRPDENYHQPFP
jgi:hypothetical protein